MGGAACFCGDFRGSSVEDPRGDVQVAVYSREALGGRSLLGKARFIAKSKLGGIRSRTKMAEQFEKMTDHFNRAVTLVNRARTLALNAKNLLSGLLGRV